MKGPIIYIVFLALLTLAFGLGRYTAKPARIVDEQTRVDTLILRDTVTRYKPEYIRTHTRDTIRVPVAEVRYDTVAVYLPREVRVYEDTRYRAEVSGYQPSLDRIDIYTQTEIVTQNTTQVVKQRARWGLGISAGYGVALDLKGQTFMPAPYIGIGLHYNLISW